MEKGDKGSMGPNTKQLEIVRVTTVDSLAVTMPLVKVTEEEGTKVQGEEQVGELTSSTVGS